MSKPKLVRITTVPISLDKLLEGQLGYMTSQFDVIAMSQDDDGYLQKVASRENVKYQSIQLTRSITPIADLSALYKLTQYFRKEKPDIVHTHTPKAGTIGMLAAKLAGVPIKLHTVAGLPLMEVKGPKRSLLNIVEKLTYVAADKVLPNSFGLRDIILDLGFARKDKLQVIGQGSSNGIDTTYFDPKLYSQEQKDELRQKWQITPEDFVFIFVGRLVKDKGIEELVHAFSQLNEKHVKLLLVGPFEHDLDPLSESTLQQIKKNPQIITTGWQSDVRPFFAISQALSFPSYREGFPNVVMQAGAMGLPSIVSNINGCNEIIRHNENGIIVPVKDITALQDAMTSLLHKIELYAKLQINARTWITKNYEREEMWKKIANLYQEALAQKK